MFTKKFKKALIETSKKINKNIIDWVLIESANHLLQGIDKEPNDINILVKRKKLKRAKKEPIIL